MVRKTWIQWLAVLALMMTGGGTAVAAEDAAAFYKGKTVTLVVNSKPGGGTDFGARLFAEYWSEATGGTMVVKNEPGGGGLVALNKVYLDDPDGLTIGTAVLGAHVVTFPLFERSGVKFDATKFGYLGHFADEPYSFAVGKDQPYATVADLRAAKGLVFGAPDPVSTPASGSAILIEFLGLDAKTVPGFRGGELGLAAGKQEIAGFSLHGSGLAKALAKEFIRPPLVTIAMQRSAWFPDVPALPEVTALDPGQQNVVELFEALTTGKVFFAPPGVPAERLAYLRAAFDRVIASPGFLAKAQGRWKAWSAPIPGTRVEAMVKKVMALPKADVERYREITRKHTQ